VEGKGEACLKSLREAVIEAALLWPQLTGGDPNTRDVYWHAGRVVRLLKLKMPTSLPVKDDGLALVEAVESRFFSDEFMRNLPPEVLAERGEDLFRYATSKGIHFESPAHCYVAALYCWHGCLNMAKVTRKTFVVTREGEEAAYTDEMRMRDYSWLQKCWMEEDQLGNPWVRYGTSLARLLEIKRSPEQKPGIEHWIPNNSPYWDC
jgi:hypothetical protein